METWRQMEALTLEHSNLSWHTLYSTIGSYWIDFWFYFTVWDSLVLIVFSTYNILIFICNSWLLLQILLWSIWEICHSWILYHILLLAVCLSSLTHSNCWLLHPSLRYPILLVVFPTTRYPRLLHLRLISTCKVMPFWLFQLPRSAW